MADKGDADAKEADDEDDDADDHAGAQTFTGGVATGVQGGLGWGCSAGVVRCAAVGCAHGISTGLDSVHDSGDHGHVETGCCGGGVGGARGSRVVAAGVDRVKMHVRDGSFWVFLWLLNGSLFFGEFRGSTARALSCKRESMMRARCFPVKAAVSLLCLGRVLYVNVNKECRLQRRHIGEQRDPFK